MSCKLTVSKLTVLALMGLTAPWAHAQCEVAQVTGSEAAAGDRFGTSVGIFGDVAVAGVPFDDGLGSDSGSFFVYRRSGASWIEEARLTASDAGPGALFGTSVRIDGEVIVTGASRDDSPREESGSAYVFRFNGTDWIEEQKLTASDGAAGDRFGGAVDVSGDVVVVGAPWDDHSTTGNLGSAYVFRFDGDHWIQEAKLVAADAGGGRLFGIRAAIEGNVIVVGAPAGRSNGVPTGTAYVFRFDDGSWVEQAKLVPSDGASQDHFGDAVSISGDTAMIGAYNHGDSDPPEMDGHGAVYVFRLSGGNWVEDIKLQPDDLALRDQFGSAVALSGDMAAIGAPRVMGPGPMDEAVYLYERDEATWIIQARLTASGPTVHDYYGLSVAVDHRTVLIGAPFSDGACSKDIFCNSGSAYVTTFPGDCMDLTDFAQFQNCFTGSSTGGDVFGGCAVFDHEPDGDVDLADFEWFLPSFAGP